MDNCDFKAILRVPDPENQEYFSKMIGNITVPNKGISTNYAPYTGEVTGYSYQVTEHREPIIYPHELATLNDIPLVTPNGFCRVEKSPHYELKEKQEDVYEAEK